MDVVASAAACGAVPNMKLVDFILLLKHRFCIDCKGRQWTGIYEIC